MSAAGRADIVRAGAVACDIGVADLRHRAEFHGDFDADILTDGEYALTAFYSVAEFSAGCDGRSAATFSHGHARLCEGRYGNGYAYRGKLVCYGRQV